MVLPLCFFISPVTPIAKWPAPEWREARSEHYTRIGQVGIGHDAVIDDALGFFQQGLQ